MVREQEDILSAIRKDAAHLRQLGVTRLAVFGSAARGELAPDSDLDFLLELRHKLSTATWT